MTLLLCAEEQVLSRPLLYLSLYLKENRDEYYSRLQAIRTDGEWEAWLRFFLEGVVAVARSATETTRRIVALIEGDGQRVLSLGRAAGSAAQIHQLVTREVVFTIPEGARRTGLSEVTIAKAAAHLEGLGIVREVTGKPRNKLFAYGSYLALLQEGTEPGT